MGEYNAKELQTRGGVVVCAVQEVFPFLFWKRNRERNLNFGGRVRRGEGKQAGKPGLVGITGSSRR